MEEMLRRWFLPLSLLSLGLSAATAPTARPVIVALGDSLGAGFNLPPGQSYPDVLQRLLDQQGYRYRVINESVSGDTSTGALQRVPQVVAEKPQFVVVEIGGNDGLRGQPITAIRANLSMIVERLQAAGAKVVLAGITLPPNYGPEYIKPFEGMYASVAKQYKLAYLPFLLINVYDKEGMMQADGIHPTAKGCAIVAQNVFNVLKPLLRK